MGFLKLALNTLVKMANISADNQRRVVDLNQRGIYLANANRYDEALSCFLRANQIVPK